MQRAAALDGEGEVSAWPHDARNVHGATLTRRQFVKTGGALVVGFGLLGREAAQGLAGADGYRQELARRRGSPTSWFEIHADNTILMRTGKVDFGQSTAHTAYKQLVAEELSVPFEAITTVVMGDTDRTPDGGFSAGFLEYGGTNLRKAAAYTYQALLDLAATTLSVDKSQLSVKDGVIVGRRQARVVRRPRPRAGAEADHSGRGRSHQHVRPDGDRQSADEADEPVLDHRQVVRQRRHARQGRREGAVGHRRATARHVHGRVVHPKTLGSTLVAAGTIDKAQFPNARVIVKGNLVGVVAPDEWEAIKAAQAVAARHHMDRLEGTARPGAAAQVAARSGGLEEHAGRRRARRTTATSRRRFPAAAKSFTASYELPFMKHAPIGPTVAVGDVRPDGTVFVHTHNQNPQALRGQLAMMLATSVDNVVVRIYAGPGHYGRSNGGNAGAEDEAVILSKALGQARPRAVDARRRPDVVHAVAGRVLRHPHRLGRAGHGHRLSRPITTCRRCRTTGSSAR